MQLATFWEQLEREARPHLEQKLAALGWVLLAGSGHVWRARRVKEIEGWGHLVVRATSAQSVATKITEREERIALERGRARDAIALSLAFAEDDLLHWEWD